MAHNLEELSLADQFSYAVSVDIKIIIFFIHHHVQVLQMACGHSYFFD